MTSIPVLMYHSINDDSRSPHAPLSFRRREFIGHLRALRTHGLRMVSLADFWDGIREGSLDSASTAVLTFDDGYIDNLTIAAPILAEFGARASIFVNTEMTSRRRMDAQPAWGTMTSEELGEIEATGVFDVESHCASHDRVFRSPRVVDLYDPSRFDRYYWLAWRLDPETRKSWRGELKRFANAIPLGYPVCESDRGLVTREFVPDDEAVARCRADFVQNPDRARDTWCGVELDGEYESEADYAKRREREIVESKVELESIIGHPVRFVCFPGGAYDSGCLELASSAGFQGYMLSSTTRGFNADELVKRMLEWAPVGSPIPVKRMAFSNEFPGFARSSLGASINAWLKIGATRGHPIASTLFGFARSARHATNSRGVR